MVSFTEEQLRDNFDKLQTGVSDFRSKLNSTKLDLPNTTANDQSFRGFESRITYLAADTIKLQAAVQERQKRKQDMAGEVYDSHVVADLVKSRALMGHLDTLLKDLGHFKKKAAHNEQIGKMGMSSLDLLKAQSVLASQGAVAAGSDPPINKPSEVEKRVKVKAHTRKWPTKKPNASTPKSK